MLLIDFPPFIDLAACGETGGYVRARKKRRLSHQRPYRICSISEMCLTVAEILVFMRVWGTFFMLCVVVFLTILSKSDSALLSNRCNDLTFGKDNLRCISEKEKKLQKNIYPGTLFRHRFSHKPVSFSVHKVLQIAQAICMPVSDGAVVRYRSAHTRPRFFENPPQMSSPFDTLLPA